MRAPMVLTMIIVFVLLFFSLLTKRSESIIVIGSKMFLFGAVSVMNGETLRVNCANAADFADDSNREVCVCNIMIYDMDGKMVDNAELPVGSNMSMYTDFMPDDGAMGALSTEDTNQFRPAVMFIGSNRMCEGLASVEVLNDSLQTKLYLNPQVIQSVLPKPTPTPAGGGGGG